MSITRPSSLSQEEMDKLLERLANTGARITMTDPRVTQAQTWILIAVGSAFIACGGWLIQSVNALNATMGRVVTQNEYTVQSLHNIDSRLDRQEDRLRAVERAVK